MPTVCSYFQEKAMKAVEEWDGVSNLDLVALLERELGELLPPTVAVHDEKRERKKIRAEAIERIDEIKSDMQSLAYTLDELRDKLA